MILRIDFYQQVVACGDRFVGRPILAAACLRAGFFDGQQEPRETRLQPRLAALQDAASGNFFVDTGH
jgi:hypothetical protein